MLDSLTGDCPNYLEQVIDAMPAGLVMVDAGLRASSMNRMMAELLGVSDALLTDNRVALAELIPCRELAERAAETLASGTRTTRCWSR